MDDTEFGEPLPIIGFWNTLTEEQRRRAVEEELAYEGSIYVGFDFNFTVGESENDTVDETVQLDDIRKAGL